MNIEFITSSVEETRQMGEKVAHVLAPGDIICLAGDLGAGKTSFAQGVARGLKIQRPVTSPTFNLIKEYTDGRLPLYHFDVYRLDCSEQLLDLGYEDYFYGEGVTLIEWPERIQPMLPAEKLWVELKYGDFHEQRHIFFTPKGERYRQLMAEVNML